MEGTQICVGCSMPSRMRALVNRQPGLVVDAKPNHGPPVVPAGLKAIQFIAALRAVFVHPDVAGVGMDGEPLHVPMSPAPDLRPGAGAVDERIVGRYAAVVVQPDGLAMVIRQILRRVRLEVSLGWNLPISERQKEEAVLVERDLAAEVPAALGDRLEQLLHTRQPIVLEAAADEGGGRLLAVSARLRVA